MRNDTRDYFDRLAPEWDHRMPPKEADRYLEPLRKLNLKSDEILLDIGTGTGILLPYLFSLHPMENIFALDISAAMLAECSCKHPFFTNLICADAKTIPLPDHSVDALVCFAVYPHFENPDPYLHEFVRLLRSGGRILIFHLMSSVRLNQLHQSLPYPLSSHVLPPVDELSSVFLRYGFAPLELTETEHLYLALFVK